MNKTKTLLAQFWVIMYTTSEFNFYEKKATLLTQFSVMIYITSEFNFDEKKNYSIGSILVNDLHN